MKPFLANEVLREIIVYRGRKKFSLRVCLRRNEKYFPCQSLVKTINFCIIHMKVLSHP
jgi:hypothetical protein